MSALVRRGNGAVAAVAALGVCLVASAHLFEASTSDGGLTIGYGPRWMVRNGDERSFYIVKESGEALRVGRLLTVEGSVDEIAAQIEEDLKSIGAKVERKPFKGAGAQGYQIEGDLVRRDEEYHLLQTVVGEKGSVYLITAVMAPDQFRAAQAEVREIVASVVIGEALVRDEISETDWVSPLPEEAVFVTPSASPQLREEKVEQRRALETITPEPLPTLAPVEEASRKHGWLGAEIVTVTPEVKRDKGLSVSDGVLVVGVLPGGPAEKAGMRSNDVIRGLGGQNVRTATGLAILVSERSPGETVDVSIIRGSGVERVQLRVGERPETPVPPREKGWLGAAIQTMTPEAAAQAGVFYVEGVLVVDIVEGGPAAKAGVRPKDIVKEFDGKAVRRAEEMVMLVDEAAPGTEVKISVIRDGKGVEVAAVIGPQPK